MAKKANFQRAFDKVQQRRRKPITDAASSMFDLSEKTVGIDSVNEE